MNDRGMKNRGMKRLVALVAAVPLAACIPATEEPVAQTAPVVTALASVAVAVPKPTPAPVATGPAQFVFDGELTQGGWIRGQAPAGSETVALGEQQVPIDEDGYFFAAFDRDEGAQVMLTAVLGDGAVRSVPITVAPRDWQIERVNVARRAGGMSDAFWRIREPELNRINAAREVRSATQGWRQAFIWPATGRISGRFGSQRIYRGEPGSYHSGLDIAPGAGVPFVAPADGVVVLAAPEEFSLEGKLLILDHGMGLNSAFLHASRLDVQTGDTVRQGQQLGLIGATGRATGPHLHWSMKWQDSRLDPLLFLSPMP